MNQANRSYRSLDFGSCQIRVLRVNDAPASFPVPTLETPEQAYDFWNERRNRRVVQPDQECVTIILLAAPPSIGWNLVSLGTLDRLSRSSERGAQAVAANAYSFVLVTTQVATPTPS
jgi:hypothetical protein